MSSILSRILALFRAKPEPPAYIAFTRIMGGRVSSGVVSMEPPDA